jgi:HicB family
MNAALSLRLPASLHKQAKLLAEQEGISVNQLISTALAEKLAALATEEYLQQRGQRASRRKFDAALSRVPNVEAEPRDKR